MQRSITRAGWRFRQGIAKPLCSPAVAKLWSPLICVNPVSSSIPFLNGKLCSASSNINPQARLLQRLLIGHATDLELDANGRILLPAMLRDYAGLSKKLVLVGQGNKIEIWSEDQWKESMQGWLAEDSADLIKDGDAFTGLSV